MEISPASISKFVIALLVMSFGAAPVLAGQKKSDADAPVSPWIHVCKDGKTKGKERCQIIQQILEKKSKKILLSGAVRLKQKGSVKTPTLLLQLPHGMYIPAGIVVQIDKSKIKKTIAQTCDRRGCFAGLPIDDKTLAKLKSGKKLVVAFNNLKKQTIAITLSLDGFSESYAKLIAGK